MAQDNQRKKKRQNIRLPLIGSFTNRDYTGSKDQRFINIFPETRKVESIEATRIFLTKRPGLSLYKTFTVAASRGGAYFNGAFYLAIGNKIIKDGTPPTDVITLTGSTGRVGMLVSNSSTRGDYLFICDGTSAWTINTSGTVTQITNDMVRFISLSAGGSGYTPANGTFALTFTGGGGGTGLAATATTTGGSISRIDITNYGSGYTSAPTVTFTNGGAGTGASATAYLNAFPTPHVPIPATIDGYMLLAKGSDLYNCTLDEPVEWDSSNYLSAEIYPDVIVGLARQNNQVVAFGEKSTEFFYDAANISGSPLTRNESTAIQIGCAAPYAIYQEEKFFFYVGQSDSGGRAVWQVEGFQPKRVSDEFIDRIIDAETNITSATGYGFRTMGHLFYVLNLPTLNKTLVYDSDEKLWHEWSTWTGTAHSVFAYSTSIDKDSGAIYLLHDSNGGLYKLDPTVYQDDATTITCDVITNRYDMDTYKRKFMHLALPVGDAYETGNSIDIRWSNDDYKTWSNWKTITLTDEYPSFSRLGEFRRRAFHLRHTLNYPLRLESLEVTYTEGET